MTGIDDWHGELAWMIGGGGRNKKNFSSKSAKIRKNDKKSHIPREIYSKF